MNNLKQIAGIALAGVLCAASGSAAAANWLKLQGTEPTDAAPRAKVWGFIQPEYQRTDGTDLKAGPWQGQEAQFNLIGPDLQSDDTFQIRRARIGVRGTNFPLDSKVNYFILTEWGNNGITRPAGGTGSAKLTDASITFNHIPGARIRVGLFKYPGAEEGLQAIHTFDYINFTNLSNQLLLERYFDGDGSAPCTTTSSTAPACVNSPNGPVGAFRDVGIQLFDFFRAGGWEHSYAVMLGNGNGPNRGDNDSNKDLYLYWSSELLLGNGPGGVSHGPRSEGWKLFAWSQTGKRTLTGAGGTGGAGEYDRKRYGVGTTYRNGKYRATAEYVKADGMIFNGTDGGAVGGAVNNAGTAYASYNVLPDDKANGWYVDAGYLVTPKWEVDARYDVLNRGTDVDANERKFETITLGAQYFVNRKTRVVLNYENRSAEAPKLPGGSPPNQILAGIDDRLSAEVLLIF